MARFITGTSGNPQGRPRQQTTQQLLRQAIQEALPDVVTVLIKQARAGDQGACKILLDKGLASLKPQADAVIFDICPDDTTGNIGRVIIDKISRGEISADIGAQLLNALSAQQKILEVDEISARLEHIKKLLEPQK